MISKNRKHCHKASFQMSSPLFSRTSFENSVFIHEKYYNDSPFMLSSHIWTGEKERKQHQSYFRHYFMFITAASKVGCRKQKRFNHPRLLPSFILQLLFFQPSSFYLVPVKKKPVSGEKQRCGGTVGGGWSSGEYSSWF